VRLDPELFARSWLPSGVVRIAERQHQGFAYLKIE